MFIGFLGFFFGVSLSSFFLSYGRSDKALRNCRFRLIVVVVSHGKSLTRKLCLILHFSYKLILAGGQILRNEYSNADMRNTKNKDLIANCIELVFNVEKITTKQ
jgi:hypothetical protein